MDTWPIWLLVAAYLGWNLVSRFAGKLTDRVAIEPLVTRLLTRKRETVTLYSSPSDVQAIKLAGVEIGCSAPGRPTPECGREYVETHSRL